MPAEVDEETCLECAPVSSDGDEEAADEEAVGAEEDPRELERRPGLLEEDDTPCQGSTGFASIFC
jgi:hypothetical protein